MTEKITKPYENEDARVYHASEDTIDELWARIRLVCGECEVDVYGDGELEPQRRDADIRIKYNSEFSVWSATIVVPQPWWE